MNIIDNNDICFINKYQPVEKSEEFNIVNYGDMYKSNAFTINNFLPRQTMVNSAAIPVEFIDLYSKGKVFYASSETLTEATWISTETPWFFNDKLNGVIVFPANRLFANNLTESCSRRFEITKNEFYKQYLDILKKIGKFSKFADNWDSYGAKPIDKECIAQSLKVIEELIRLKSIESFKIPNPFIAPLSSGGIQIEWEENDRYLEITISPNNPNIDYFATDKTKGGQLSLEGPLKSVTFLNELLAWFVNGKAEDLSKLSLEFENEYESWAY